MKNMIQESSIKLPFRYKFRTLFLSTSMLVSSWALASLVPNQNLTLAHQAAHQTVATEKLGLSFTQKKTVELNTSENLLKPTTFIDNSVKKQTKEPNKTTEAALKTKEEILTIKQNKLEWHIPETPENKTTISLSKTVELQENNTPQTENLTVHEADHNIDSLAQTRLTHNPLVSEPSFSKPPEQPRYPSLAKRRGQQGTVWLEVWLDAAGEQIKREITASSGVNILDQAALKAVSSWEFLPFSQEDITISSRVKIPVQFVLN